MNPSRRSVLLAASVALGPWPFASLIPQETPGGPTELERTEPDRLLLMIDKIIPLEPLDYAPPDLVPWRDSPYEIRTEVADHLDQLFIDAEAEGHLLEVISGYRSYQTQAETYQSWADQYGTESADATSAQAGHSEHQTGLAVDLNSRTDQCYLDACFGDTAPGQWVADNAHRYGFILSYPPNSRDRTGYVYEPWHFRYVGPRIAHMKRDLGALLLADLISTPYAPARLAWSASRNFRSLSS